MYISILGEILLDFCKENAHKLHLWFLFCLDLHQMRCKTLRRNAGVKSVKPKRRTLDIKLFLIEA